MRILTDKEITELKAEAITRSRSGRKSAIIELCTKDSITHKNKLVSYAASDFGADQIHIQDLYSLRDAFKIVRKDFRSRFFLKKSDKVNNYYYRGFAIQY